MCVSVGWWVLEEKFWEWEVSFTEILWDWGLFVLEIWGILMFGIKNNLPIVFSGNACQKQHPYSGIGYQIPGIWS